MRDFFRASPTFWRRGTGKKLRGDKGATILAWYLMVPPDGGLTGIFPASVGSMSHDTGLTPDEVKQALVRLDAEDFAYFDPKEEYVWVVGTVRHQVPDGIKNTKDNRWSGIVRELRQAGQHEFVSHFLAMYGSHLMVGADNLAEDRSKTVNRPSARLCTAVRSVDEADGQTTFATPGPLARVNESQREREGREKRGEGDGREEGRTSVATPASPAAEHAEQARVPDAPVESATRLVAALPVEFTAARSTRTRGTRIADDWRPSYALLAWCESEGVDGAAIVPEFTDYWRAVAGARGVKLDWDAVFRNRVRVLKELGRAPTTKGRPYTPPPAKDMLAEMDAILGPTTASPSVPQETPADVTDLFKTVGRVMP